MVHDTKVLTDMTINELLEDRQEVIRRLNVCRDDLTNLIFSAEKLRLFSSGFDLNRHNAVQKHILGYMMDLYLIDGMLAERGYEKEIWYDL